MNPDVISTSNRISDMLWTNRQTLHFNNSIPVQKIESSGMSQSEFRTGLSSACENLQNVCQQVPMNHAVPLSGVDSKDACANKSMSASTLSAQSESPRNKIFIIGPPFSLADSYDNNFELPGQGESKSKQMLMDHKLLLSDIGSKEACKNKIMSSSTPAARSESFKNKMFITGSPFSLAGSQENHVELQRQVESKANHHNSSLLLPFSNLQIPSHPEAGTHPVTASVPTKQPFQESQICIGCVFSLAASNIEDIGTNQQIVDNNLPLPVFGSLIHDTQQECQGLHHVNKSAVAQKSSNPHTCSPLDSPQSSTFTASDAATKLVANNCMHVSILNMPTYPSVFGSKVRGDILSENMLKTVTNMSVESFSRNISVSTLIDSDTHIHLSPAPAQRISAAVKSTRHILLSSPNQQEDADKDVTKAVEICNKPATESAVADLTQYQETITALQTHLVATCNQDPEVVDLDTEDIDDCMLVKIDLSSYFPYGRKIHNTEVIIDDSDNEDVTNLTAEAEHKNCSSQSVSHNNCDLDPSASTGVINRKCKTSEDGSISNLVLSESVSYGVTNALDMEVTKVNTENDSEENSNQTSVGPDILDGTKMVTNEVDNKGSAPTWSLSMLHDQRNSEVLHSRQYAHLVLPTKVNKSLDCRIDVIQKNTKYGLSVENEALVSEFTHYSSLPKAAALHPDNTSSTYMKSNPLISNILLTPPVSTHSSIILTPVIDGHKENTHSNITFQAQGEKTHYGNGFSQLYPNDLAHDPVLQVANNAPENVSDITIGTHEQTISKHPNISLHAAHMSNPVKPLLGKTKKDTAENSNIMCYLESLKKSCKESIGSTDRIPANEMTSKSQMHQIVCKICLLDLPSRSELVTHSWNCHRHTDKSNKAMSHKCATCGKTFTSKSLLKLHCIVKCPSLSKPVSLPHVAAGPESVRSALIRLRQNRLKANLRGGGDKFRKQTADSTNFSGDKSIKYKDTITVSFSNTSERVTDNAANNISIDKFIADSSQVNNFKEIIDSQVYAKETVPSTVTVNISLSKTNQNDNRSTVGCVKFETGTDSDANCFGNTQKFGGSVEQFKLPANNCSSIRNEHLNKGSEPADITPCIESFSRKVQGPHGAEQENNHKSISQVKMHMCCKCKKTFLNESTFLEHQKSHEIGKTGEHAAISCFVCARTFRDAVTRYKHMLDNPGCKEGIDKFCSKCSLMFTHQSDRQAHLNISEPCYLHEVQILKDVAKNSWGSNLDHIAQNKEMIAAHVGQSVKSQETTKPHKKETDKVSAKQIIENRTVTEGALTDGSFLGVNCELCKLWFPNYASLKHHFQTNSDCKRHNNKLYNKHKDTTAQKVNQPNDKHYNKQDTTAQKVNKLNDKHFIPGNTLGREEKMFQCKVCGKECSSQKDLTEHKAEKSCTFVLDAEETLPKTKSLKITLNPVSIKCKVCHLPFSDDLKYTEHFQSSQPCRKVWKERSQRSMAVKKLSLVGETFKEAIKDRSCEMATGIGNASSKVTIKSTASGLINFTEKSLEFESTSGGKLNEMQYNMNRLASSDVRIFNSSASDEGNQDSSDNDSLTHNKLSSSDDERDMGETDTSRDIDRSDYKCVTCSRTFTCRSLFIKHTNLHHSSQRRKVHCKVCTRKFIDLTGLQAHLLQYKFCFIHLTRKLWERKEDPQVCSMCQKILHSPKQLRKHSFKKMACRLHYVNVVLKNISDNDTCKGSLSASEEDVQVSEDSGDGSLCLNKLSPTENSNNYNKPGTSLIKDENSSLFLGAATCRNCDKHYTDFIGHIFCQQACLDFYGTHIHKCPAPVPFCFQCKTRFENVGLLSDHNCRGFISYTHECQTCFLKFTSQNDFKTHTQHSGTCGQAAAVCLNTINKENEGPAVPGDPSEKSKQGSLCSLPPALAASLTVKDNSSSEQSFPCMICKTIFPMLRLLMEHSSQHLEAILSTCDRCNITFHHYNQLVSHQAFHIRMDKEASKSTQQLTFSVSPSLMEKSQSPSLETSEHTGRDIIRDQLDQNISESLCIFCHINFPTEKIKRDHVSSAHACMGIMKYIVENKLYFKDTVVKESNRKCTADGNTCDFCEQSVLDKISHFLKSSCFNKLEEAILKYRANPSPVKITCTEAEESKNVSEEAASNIIPSPSNQKIQREQAFNEEKSEDSFSEMVGDAEVVCCVTCNCCLKTVAEVKRHKSSCKRLQLLPQSALQYADWDFLRCKQCNSQYALRGYLVNHLISEHCGDTNILLEAGRHRTSLCILCKKRILIVKLHAHFLQHKKTFIESLEDKYKLSLSSSREESCIFCNKVCFNMDHVNHHVKRHTFSDIFISQSQTRAAVTEQKESFNCKLVTGNTRIFKAQCKLCRKQFSRVRFFKLHFRMSHRGFDLERWKGFLSFIEPSDERKTLQDSHGKVKQKTGNLRQMLQLGENSKGSCKLCHKKFSQLNSFELHFKSSHSQYNPERWQELFAVTKNNINSSHTMDINSKGTCKLCHKTFSQLINLRRHFKLAHRHYNPERGEKLFKLRENNTDNFGASEDPSCVQSVPFLQKSFSVQKLKSGNKLKIMWKRQQSDSVEHNLSNPNNLQNQSATVKPENVPQSGSCNVCHKKFLQIKNFKIHFKLSHKEYDPERCMESFSCVGPPEPNKSSMGTNENPDSLLTQSLVKMDKDNKSERKFRSRCKLKSQPIMRCKICHKKFTSLPCFKFHWQTSHPADQKKLFKPFVLPEWKDSVKKNKTSESAFKSQNNHPVTYEKGYTKAKEMCSFDEVGYSSLPKICLICQFSFIDFFLYQKHLREHLKQCSIVLHDIRYEIKTSCESEPVIIQNMEQSLAVSITSEDDNDVVYFTSNTSSLVSQKEIAQPDSTTSDDTKHSPGISASSLDLVSTDDICESNQNKCMLKNVPSFGAFTSGRIEVAKQNKGSSDFKNHDAGNQPVSMNSLLNHGMCGNSFKIPDISGRMVPKNDIMAIQRSNRNELSDDVPDKLMYIQNSSRSIHKSQAANESLAISESTIKKPPKRHILEISCDQDKNTKLKRSKMSFLASPVRDCVLMEDLVDVQSVGLEKDCEVIKPETKKNYRESVNSTRSSVTTKISTDFNQDPQTAEGAVVT